MSVITVRNLDPAVKRRIERRASAHGRSMEAEIRAILESTPEPGPRTGILAAMRRAHEAMGEGALDLPPRAEEEQRDVPLR
jgi:plasmid stability protein